MKTHTVWGILFALALVATAAPFAATQAAGPEGPAALVLIGAEDAVTASDAGGGYLTTRDILLVIIIGLAIVGLIAIL